MATDYRYACAVCGEILNELAERAAAVGTGEWIHNYAVPDDHPVVPVPIGEIRAAERCDFCYDLGSPWVLPATNFEIAPGLDSVGNWGACDRCAELLRRARWQALASRAHAAFVSRYGPTPRSYLETMYTALRVHVTGPVRLWTPNAIERPAE